MNLLEFVVLKKTPYGQTNGPTDGRTDRLTDRQMDKASYRDAWTHLKRKKEKCKKGKEIGKEER